MRRAARDDGTITLLVLGFAVVAMLLVAVVVDVSAVYLARRQLVSAADSAALTAAQQVDLTRYYEGTADDPGTLPLDPALVARAVHDLAERFPDVRFDRPELTDGGRAVRVRVTRVVALPLGHAFGIEAVTVSAEATARIRRRA